MRNMLRRLAVGLALAAGLSGCFGGGGGEEDGGTLDPTALDRTVERATFRVRVPARLRSDYELLNLGSLTGPRGHYAVDFDLVAGDGRILTVDQGEDADVGVIRAYTSGARALGRDRIGLAVWHVYDQPDVGGLVYARRYADGVEVVLAGGTDRGPLRTLARSLRPPL